MYKKAVKHAGVRVTRGRVRVENESVRRYDGQVVQDIIACFINFWTFLQKESGCQFNVDLNGS